MNKTNFKQYDTRWAKLGYPKKPWYIRDCGCGEVAVANCIIEMSKYAKETPKTIQPYCKQYAAPNGDGTYFSGIPKMMAHYGMTEVKEHQTMAQLWKELAKGDRVAIYLMGNRKGGSKGVHWTSSAHFVCSVAYKVKDGKHMVYVKDSNSTSELRNGWVSYEGNMRNDVSRVWSGKLPTAKKEPAKEKKKTPQQKMVAWAKKIAADNSYHYVHWKRNDPNTKKCPICHDTPKGKYHGWYCTSWVLAPWRHGAGIKMKCGNALNNGCVDKIYNAKTDAEALKLARKYLGVQDIKVIRSKKNLPMSKLEAGDMCYYFKGGSCKHAFFYIGDGKMIDANSYKDVKRQIAVRKAMSCKVAIRYIGK